MRVLIKGGGFRNKGAEAMLLTMAANVRRKWADAEVVVVDEPPELCERHGLSRVALHPKQSGLRRLLLSIGRRTRFACGHGFWAAAYPPLKPLRQLDAVIDISGYRFGDVWAARQEVVDIWSNQVGAPVLYMPQAWGPFEDPVQRRFTEEVLKPAAALFARDRVSLEHLQQLKLNVPAKLAPDVAFCFTGSGPDIGRRMLQQMALPEKAAGVIGLVPNMRIYARSEGKDADNGYIRAFVALADDLVRRTDCAVAVMPHEIKPNQSNSPDDRFLCRLICENVEQKDRIKPWTEPASAADLKAMIGGLDLLIASRFHSIIAALSQHIPVAAIGWSHKYVELLNDAGLTGNVVSWEQLETDELCRRALQFWQQRDAMRQTLEQTIPPIKRASAAAIDEALATLDQK